MKTLKKAQKGGINKDTLFYKKMAEDWNKKEREVTNPKNKKTMDQIQKEWREGEKKSTNPNNKSNKKIELFKKGGVTKSTKKK